MSSDHGFAFFFCEATISTRNARKPRVLFTLITLEGRLTGSRLTAPRFDTFLGEIYQRCINGAVAYGNDFKRLARNFASSANGPVASCLEPRVMFEGGARTSGGTEASERVSWDGRAGTLVAGFTLRLARLAAFGVATEDPVREGAAGRLCLGCLVVITMVYVAPSA